MISQTSSLARLVESDSGIAGTYRHIAKSVTPDQSLELFGARLKWYTDEA